MIMLQCFSQIEWAPWVGCEDFRGYGRVLTMSRTRCLVHDEYRALFYLGERVVRQHTHDIWPRVPAFLPLLMRRTAEINSIMVLALQEGLDFRTFVEEGDYAAFAALYLMREPKGV